MVLIKSILINYFCYFQPIVNKLTRRKAGNSKKADHRIRGRNCFKYNEGKKQYRIGQYKDYFFYYYFILVNNHCLTLFHNQVQFTCFMEQVHYGLVLSLRSS